MSESATAERHRRVEVVGAVVQLRPARLAQVPACRINASGLGGGGEEGGGSRARAEGRQLCCLSSGGSAQCKVTSRTSRPRTAGKGRRRGRGGGCERGCGGCARDSSRGCTSWATSPQISANDTEWGARDSKHRDNTLKRSSKRKFRNRRLFALFVCYAR
jgi:hypothetical protein